MKAMILAAGKGTRVRPITHIVPKPMIPILQKPVMEFLLELLREHGFTEIMVNVSHLAEEIENYFRDGQRFGVEIAYSFEGRIEDGQLIGDALGSAGGLKKIQTFQRFFDDTFVVLCGDALIDLDLSEAVRRHKAKGAMASLITKRVPRDQVSSYGVVVTDNDGRVLSFQEKPAVDEAASDMINTGIYIFEPEVLDYVPDGVPFDIGSDLFPRLVADDAADILQPVFALDEIVEVVRRVGVEIAAIALDCHFAQKARGGELVQGVVDRRQGHIDTRRHRFMVEAFGAYVAVACSKQDGSQR